MREIRQSGSEGGAGSNPCPYPDNGQRGSAAFLARSCDPGDLRMSVGPSFLPSFGQTPMVEEPLGDD